ncbi:MAG: TolR-like protein [Burkholderia sp.]|jgi:biopolymer transport protein TolR
MMSLREQKKRRGLMAEMNVVPYIDVMLVLVVILMVASPFVNPALVNLPSVTKASKAPDKIVEVIVYPDSRLSVRSGKELKPVDMPGLVAAVKEAQADRPDTPVVIAADKTVRYEEVINVLKTLQNADVQRVGLSLKTERTASSR